MIPAQIAGGKEKNNRHFYNQDKFEWEPFQDLLNPAIPLCHQTMINSIFFYDQIYSIQGRTKHDSKEWKYKGQSLN